MTPTGSLGRVTGLNRNSGVPRFIRSSMATGALAVGGEGGGVGVWPQAGVVASSTANAYWRMIGPHGIARLSLRGRQSATKNNGAEDPGVRHEHPAELGHRSSTCARVDANRSLW